MNPPDWLAARVTCSERATSIRCEADSLVHTISAPAFRQISSAARLAATGSATRADGCGSGHQRQQHQQGLVVGERMAQVVHDGHVLASRVEDRPQVGARGPHQLGDPGGAGLAVEGEHAGGVGVGVDHQHLGLELGQQIGHDEAGGPERVVEDQLEVGRPGVGQVDRVDQGRRVVLQRPGREPDVADLPGQHPAEVLAVVEPLDLALGGLVDVDALLVEEPEHHGLGVVGSQPHGDARPCWPRR